MLSREESDRMVAAMQKSVERSIETYRGECVAVDEETNTEYVHRWRNGEARVYRENEDEGRGIEYVFAVRVVLVAVEPEFLVQPR